jgi:capsule polysaccharide export protein KpsE/RkpR
METGKPIWLSYFEVLFRWRKFYIVTMLGVGIVAAIVSLILPKWYQSTATILPPLQTSGFETLIPEEVRGFFGGFLGENAEANTYLAILRSRSLREKIIDHFELEKVYGLKKPYPIEDLLIALDKKISIEFDGQNPLSVAVIDRTPERASQMVNFMTDELDRMYQQMNNRQAFYNRQFLEKRVAETRVSLSNNEDSLRAFQEKYKAVSLTDQAKASIDVAADLMAKMMALDVRIQVLKASVQTDHPQLRMMVEERNGLENQIEKLSKTSKDNPNAVGPLPGLDELPELGMLYIRLYREVEIQGKLLEFLIPQYEQARIQEVRDTPTVTVLDQGRTPTKRIKPQRKILVLISMILGFIVSTAIVFSSEFFMRIKKEQPGTYQSLIQMGKQLKSNMRFIRKT